MIKYSCANIYLNSTIKMNIVCRKFHPFFSHVILVCNDGRRMYWVVRKISPETLWHICSRMWFVLELFAAVLLLKATCATFERACSIKWMCSPPVCTVYFLGTVLRNCHADIRLPVGGCTPFLCCPETCLKVRLCLARAHLVFPWRPDSSMFGGFHFTLAALGKSVLGMQ